MEKIVLNGLNIYKFASKFIDANSYVLCANQEALVIDPNESIELDNFLEQFSPQKVLILLTHEHIDHVLGAARIFKKYKTELICQKNCAEFVADARKNQPSLMAVAIEYKDERNGTHLAQEFYDLTADIFPFSLKTSRVFDEEFFLDWHGLSLFCKRCEGHSQGSCCIILNYELVFTGDSLICNTPVITRFPGGSKKDYLLKTKPFLDILPDSMYVLAGHGRCCSMKEIRSVEF